jgi:hypothetical protein
LWLGKSFFCPISKSFCTSPAWASLKMPTINSQVAKDEDFGRTRVKLIKLQHRILFKLLAILTNIWRKNFEFHQSDCLGEFFFFALKNTFWVYSISINNCYWT